MQHALFVPGSRVVGIGHYQPERILTNDELADMVDTTDEWIRTRTGIVTRHIAADEETVADLAAAAAREALKNAGLETEDLEMIIVASTSMLDHSPNAAGRVAATLGANSPAIIDVNVACSGFEHAMALADNSIRAGSVKNALVIGAEKLSAITDWSDRATCVLTADGAGAFVLMASDEVGVGPVVWGSKPSLSQAVRVEMPENHFEQDGRAIFRWAITDAAKYARAAVERAGMSLDDIDIFVPHQANLRIIEPMVKQLGFQEKVVVTDVVESGNTSAASIPLGFSKWWHQGRIPGDSAALLFGFGGGFAYAGQVIITPPDPPTRTVGP